MQISFSVMKSRTLIFNFLVLVFIAIVAASCSKDSKDKPVLLEKNDVMNIHGKIFISDDYKYTTVKLYNGTTWTLTDVDIDVARTDSKSGILTTRRFRVSLSDADKQYFKPFKYGEFQEQFGDFMDGIDLNDTTNNSIEIVSAYGFKE